MRVAHHLEPIAARLGLSPTSVAIAYALANAQVASVLFGATSPDQVEQNCQSLVALEQLSASVLDELRDG
ncbi:MAG: aldo/keto reductase [Chloroflexi bacterium]|nr:aldo/keto reductase [Chloroflexota bacterium]